MNTLTEVIRQVFAINLLDFDIFQVQEKGEVHVMAGEQSLSGQRPLILFCMKGQPFVTPLSSLEQSGRGRPSGQSQFFPKESFLRIPLFETQT